MLTENLFAIIILVFLLGCASALVLNRRENRCLQASFIIAAIASSLSIALAIIVLLGEDLHFSLYSTDYLGTFSFNVDKLSAFFILVISIASLCASIYSIGYAKEYAGSYNISVMGFVFNAFVLSMILVVSASNAVLFLILWETMSLTSFLLVTYENKRNEAVSAGLLYLVMTHLGTALITAGFVLLWTSSHSFDFEAMRNASGTISEVARSAAFLLFFLGFGTKAGLIPMHVWLPYAHPAAPSNISALMSGVMVKTAVCLMIRCLFDILGIAQGESWWGILILLVASISAVLGVLYALMDVDLKRILAFSTVENMGIIFIALGAAAVFYSYGLLPLSALALVGALLHTFNHSLFKTLLFMGAGSILFTTHTRNIEKLGGLIKRMPWTAGLFLIGALSISAIPPFNGFVSEWLIFQALLLSSSVPDTTVTLLFPVAIGILALTGALAAACFVRMFGISFLARPRSEQADHAAEVPRSMLVGMGIVAVLCVGTGIFSIYTIPLADAASSSVIGTSIASSMVKGLEISPGIGSFSSMSPAIIAIFLLLAVPVVFLAVRWYGGRTKIASGDTWDCGTQLNERTQYTATGYSQPIGRIFNSIFRSRRDVRTSYTSSPYIKKTVSYSSTILPVFEKYLYQPAARFSIAVAQRATVIQKGSIQAYLAYIFIILVLLLVIFR